MKLTIWFFMDSVPFTDEVVAGTTSLGGSESACRGTAEGLSRLGHDVKIFATKLSRPQTVNGVDWVNAETLTDALKFAPPDVFCALRTPSPFMMSVPASLNLLWNQDMLIPPHDAGIVSQLSQVDRVIFVSEYHKAQWCGLHDMLGSMSWVTRNGVDASVAPKAVARKPHRFIYVSRPERGLQPLLEMWPRLKAHWPDAELGICRYQSMYDGEGSQVAEMCRQYDRITDKVAAEVGGIVRLGALGKAELYREISASTLMLYPGIQEFAETGCIAATEAQMCGTPIVASWKGALPEAVHPDAGVLIEGDALSPEYQDRFVESVIDLVDGPAERLEAMRDAGRAWALPRYTFDTIAAEWDGWLHETFQERYRANKAGVMRQLMHWDQHAAAKRVALEIGSDRPEFEEASEALALCDRVIAQEEHTADGYARHAVKDVSREMQLNSRLRVVAEAIAEEQPKRVLDVSCGNGTLACLVADQNPQARVDGYDFSEGVLEVARQGAENVGVSDRVTFRQSDYREIPVPDQLYDVVFCGEFLEHVEKPWELLDQLERYVKPGGRIFLTTPCGPFAELLSFGMEHQRGHVHAFSVRDIATMCRHKQDYRWRYLFEGSTIRGNSVGYWFFSYAPGGGRAQELDYEQTIVTTRPYQRVVASMIVKNGADWLRKCLKSLHGVVDRIVILDTGSTDGSQDIARELGAEVVEAPWPHSFAKARNMALDLVENDAEWVLWIDADEQLMNGHYLRRFVNGAGPYQAYVLRQVHLSIDQNTYDDKPQRLFRTGCGVRFYGDVHEQPEQAPDEGITPSLDFSDPNAPRIMHWGYYEESVRRDKLQTRNLALLEQELASESPRELAYVLAIRDHCNLALFEQETHKRLTPYARASYERAIEVFREKFRDPSHKYHAIALPYYESALQALQRGVTAKWAFAATPGVTMNGTVKPRQVWAHDAEELRYFTQSQIDAWTKPLDPYVPDTTPAVDRDTVTGWLVHEVAVT